MLGFPIGAGLIDQWMEPVFHGANEVLGHGAHEPFQLLGLDGLLAGASVAVAVLGVFAAMRLFGFRVPLLGLEAKPRPEAIRRLTDRARPLYRGSFHKWFFDDLNDLIFVRFGGLLARALWWFDVHVIDGAVNGIAGFTQRSGRGLRQIQTGRVQNYALGIALSLIVVAVGYFVTGGR
jgi:NADH-quinone oxidoreductase subunit L